MTELQHYGVKGMKWGVRRVRNHAGPGIRVGSDKRKLAGAKQDLARLDKGEHLSIGATKKRQAQYDTRDRKALNKTIAKLEAKIAKRNEQFKDNLASRDPISKQRREREKQRAERNEIMQAKGKAKVYKILEQIGKDVMNPRVGGPTSPTRQPWDEKPGSPKRQPWDEKPGSSRGGRI